LIYPPPLVLPVPRTPGLRGRAPKERGNNTGNKPEETGDQAYLMTKLGSYRRLQYPDETSNVLKIAA
jgi:hypothetical protein